VEFVVAAEFVVAVEFVMAVEFVNNGVCNTVEFVVALCGSGV
jgi:hypothetical protein